MNNLIIVIATYNGMKWLPKCLKSCGGFSVMVVDNNSNDGTAEFITNNFPNVQIFPQKENLGFGKANNIGIKAAYDQGAEHIFLLNQDAYLQISTLEILISRQKKNHDYGILSPIHLDGKGDRLDSKFADYVAYEHNPDFYSDFVLQKKLKDIYPVNFVNAAAWLLSRKLIETIGGFDPIFFHYGEDENYCQRALFHGFKIGVVADAFICHDRESSNLSFTRGSAAYLKQMEISLKVSAANINNESYKDLDVRLNKRIKEKAKAIAKMDTSHIKILNEEIKLIKNIKEEVLESRECNKNRGMNYL